MKEFFLGKKVNKQNLFKWMMFSFFVLLNALIVVESCLPGDISSMQSNWLSVIFAGLINENTSITPSVVEPTSIEISGVDTLRLGTTRAYEMGIYPSDSTYGEPNFYIEGDSGDLNIVQSSYIARVEALSLGEFTLVARLDKKDQSPLFAYKNITVINRPAPTDFVASLVKDNISVGEAIQFDISINGYESEIDAERDFDINELIYTSSNESIVSVNNYGVIKGISSGQAEVSIQGYAQSFTITVSKGVEPVYPKEILIEGQNTAHQYDIDYDGLLANGEVQHCFTLLSATFIGNNPTSQGIIWTSSNEVIARVDKFGRVRGYKKDGLVTIKAISMMDETIFDEFIVNVEKVTPTKIDIIINKTFDTYSVGETFSITSTFDPFNTTDKLLLGSSSDSSIASISSIGTTLVVKLYKQGDATISISSRSNPTLSYSLTLEVLPMKAINEDNYSSFVKFVRKSLGHFLLFFIDGIIGLILMINIFKTRKNNKYIMPMVMSLSVGLFIASLSELIQHFIAGRNGNFADVGIDFAGYLLATAFTFLIYYIFYKSKQRIIKQSSLR